jgi:competence protein ComEA
VEAPDARIDPVAFIQSCTQTAGGKMRYIYSIMLSVLVLITAPAYAGAVDINSADAATLATAIVGIGEKKAAAIVQYREANGPFASVDELAQVKGIGAATVDRNRQNLSFGATGQ